MKKTIIKRTLQILLVLLVLAQFVQVANNNGEAAGPNDITQAIPVPADVKQILQTSCFNCHSNHTNYPWYSHVQPVGWWLEDHINEGKDELNFSEFTTYSTKRKAKKMKEIAEEVGEHEMPLESYLWLHSEAKLSEAQRKLLVDWAKTGMPAGESEGED